MRFAIKGRGAGVLRSVKLVDASTPARALGRRRIICRQVVVNNDRSTEISRTPLEHAAIQPSTIAISEGYGAITVRALSIVQCFTKVTVLFIVTYGKQPIFLTSQLVNSDEIVSRE